MPPPAYLPWLPSLYRASTVLLPRSHAHELSMTALGFAALAAPSSWSWGGQQQQQQQQQQAVPAPCPRPPPPWIEAFLHASQRALEAHEFNPQVRTPNPKS